MLLLHVPTLALLLILIDNVTSSVHYTNKWAAYIPGGQRVAEQVAATFGYRNHGQVRKRQRIQLVGSGGVMFIKGGTLNRENRGSNPLAVVSKLGQFCSIPITSVQLVV